MDKVFFFFLRCIPQNIIVNFGLQYTRTPGIIIITLVRNFSKFCSVQVQNVGAEVFLFWSAKKQYFMEMHFDKMHGTKKTSSIQPFHSQRVQKLHSLDLPKRNVV